MKEINYKDIAKKIISDSVKKTLSSVSMATIFLQEVCKTMQTRCKPDLVVEKSSIAGGLPWLSAIKYLKETSVDGWGFEIKEDSCCIEKGRIAGIIDATAGECLIEYSQTTQQAMEKEFGFYLLNKIETEEVLENIEKYIFSDIEDYKGNRLGALIALTMREDSPCEEWNELARKLHSEENEKAKKEEEAFFAEKMENAKKLRDGLLILLPDSQSEISVEESEFSGRWPFVIFKFEGKEIKLQPIYEEDGGEYLNTIKKYLEDCEKYKIAITELSKYRSGELPVFTYGDIKIYLPQSGSTVEVPENIVGHFIGRGGEGIKAFSSIAQKRIEIKKILAATVPRKAKVHRVSMTRKPVLSL